MLTPNKLGRLRDTMRAPAAKAPASTFDTTTGWSFDSTSFPSFDKAA